jgi:hypothetical protein
MVHTFGSVRERRISWRRELPPVLAVAGLAADYLSPAASWTILLPLGCIVLLLALRSWAAAAVVFLLSSWILIPFAVGTVSAIEESRGERPLYVIAGETNPILDEAVADRCVPDSVRFEVLPIGPGHLVNPHWALRDAIVTFVDLHNVIVIESLHRDAPGVCDAD